MTTTDHMLRVRQAKARKLAAVIVAVAAGTGRMPSDIARGMRADEKSDACRIAGVNIGSEATWTEVVEMLALAESVADSLAGVGR